MSRSHTLVIVIVGCCVGLIAGCKGSPAGREGPSGRRALRVRTAPAVQKDVVYRVQALGSLEADDLVQVTAEVEGAVAEVRFREGDRVTPETVLLRIDPERLRLEAARAEAAHRRAVASFQSAEADLKRREDLARNQLLSVEELNRSRQDTERLAADVAAAKAALDIAVQNQRRAEVRAPRAGAINSRSVDTGQYVRIGAVLATLVDTSRLLLRFKVSEGESLKVANGQAVSFRVAALGQRDFSARIFHVGDVADPATRQVEVLAWVKNPGLLKPGFFAEVAVAADARKGAVVVPESAVQASERGFVAYVVDGDGKARQRLVTIGLRTGDGTVEIPSGVKAGEVVVTEGSDRLADGIGIEAVNAAATPAGPKARP